MSNLDNQHHLLAAEAPRKAVEVVQANPTSFGDEEKNP